MSDTTFDYERFASDVRPDETEYALRAYLSRIPDEKLATYDPRFGDDELMAWDGNFRSDGALMLVCCERDIDAIDFREALERHIEQRKQARGG